MWKDTIQRMNDSCGVSQGMARVLTERGIDASRMKVEEMRSVVAEMDDFKHVKSLVEFYLIKKGHICTCISPKVSARV